MCVCVCVCVCACVCACVIRTPHRHLLIYHCEREKEMEGGREGGKEERGREGGREGGREREGEGGRGREGGRHYLCVVGLGGMNALTIGFLRSVRISVIFECLCVHKSLSST